MHSPMLSLLAVVAPLPDSTSGFVVGFGSVALRVAALLLLTAGAERLLSDHSASRRHLILVLGALGALLIPVLTLVAPRWSVAVLPAASEGANSPVAVRGRSPAPIVDHLARGVGVAIAPAAPTPPQWPIAAGPSTLDAVAPLAPLASRRGVNGRQDRAPRAMAASPSAPRAQRVAASRPDRSGSALAAIAAWNPSPSLQLFLAWLFGAGILLGQLLLGVIRRARLAATATDLLPAPWERSRARLAARGTLPARVRLYATPRSSMPMTWGVLWPIVIVPEHSAWTSDERDAALLHEVAHIRRGDALWLTVLSVVRALHWYNPLAWWLCGAERLTREEACDDRVLDAGVRPSEYAEQLLGIVRQPSEWRTPSAALAMARPSSVARRLHAILRPEQPRDIPGVAMRLASIAGAALLAACIGTATPVRRVATTPVPDTDFAPRLTIADAQASGARVVGYGASSPRAESRTGRGNLGSTSASVGVGGIGAPDVTRAADRATFPSGGFGASAANGSAAGASYSASVSGTDGDATSYAGGLAAPGMVAVWNGFGTTGTAGARSSVASPFAASQQQCDGRKGRNISSSHSRDSGDKQESIIWSRNGCKIEITSRGDYTLSPTLDDVLTLSRGGSFLLREDDGRVEREVRITPASDGTLEHRYRVDGDTRIWDTEGKTWFAQVALRLDRLTAWAVDARFPAIMARGGVDAVLAEIDLMEGDYARRIYFTKLASSAQLSSVQLVRVIDSAASRIQSDYEMAELLIAASKQKAFDDPAQLALARAAARIKSDYEKRRAFSALLAKEGLSSATVGEILAGTKGMDSDYELAELLIDVAGRYAIAPATRRYYLDALGTIQSDYEYRRVLTVIVNRGSLPAEYTSEILAHAGTHLRGYELAELLITLDKSVGRDRTLGLAFLEAADHLDSDYEHGRVLKDLIAQRPDTAVVAQLLKQARGIGSAYERAELLLMVARAYRIDGSLHDPYVDAAQSIKSEYERSRALAAAVGRRVER
ncbi:MAG: M56 family metallopeptidase [Gemmatimonadota bacterium]